jgi:uncharacterized protein DUF2752
MTPLSVEEAQTVFKPGPSPTHHPPPLPNPGRWPSDPSAPRPMPRPDPLYHIVLLVLSSSVLIAAAVLSVRNQTEVLVPLFGFPLPELCLMRRSLGIDCPGCGLTRSFISLAHGNLRGAWSYNPAGPLLFAILAFQIPFRIHQLWRIRHRRPEVVMGVAAQVGWGIFVVALMTQWALRLAGVEI